MRWVLISLFMTPFAVGCGAKCGDGTRLEGGVCVGDDTNDADAEVDADADQGQQIGSQHDRVE